MATVSLQKYTSPYERTANPQYESRTGLPKSQVMIRLGTQTNSTQKYVYSLSDTINMAMRMEVVSVYAKNVLSSTPNPAYNAISNPNVPQFLPITCPYLTLRFNSWSGRIVGEKMKEAYEGRYNGTNEFAKSGIVVPFSPDANGMCTYHQNPIVVTDFKDPKEIRSIDFEVRDVFDKSISFDDFVVELNVYCMIDN